MKQISALTKQHSNRGAAHDLNFDVTPCRVVCLNGLNGAAKSSTALPNPRESN
ncbi:MAG: hypothetical protein ABI862_20300 [Ilumatobacteraceae bacterium]